MADKITLTDETNTRFWATGYKPGRPLDMRIAEDREQSKVWMQIFREVEAEDKAGTLVLTKTEIVTDPRVLVEETNTRFWVDTGYKPNQRLDMTNAEDQKMAKAWREIFDVVKAEDAAGALVLTYNDPEVIQKLAEVQATDSAAAEHIEAGISATEETERQQHAQAASDYLDAGIAKLKELTGIQPPSVSNETIAETLSDEAPVTSAPDAVAHFKKFKQVSDSVKRMLFDEANARFWANTDYKRGKRLDPGNPMDLKQMPVWWNFYQQVQQEYEDGTFKATYKDPVVAAAIDNAEALDDTATQNLEYGRYAADQATQQAHAELAATADAMAREQMAGAAARQPPAPAGSTAAAQEAARRTAPPPPSAPATDHLGYKQAQAAPAKVTKTEEGPSYIKWVALGGLGLLGAWSLTKYVQKERHALRVIEGIERRNPIRSRPSRPRVFEEEETDIVMPLPAPMRRRAAR